MTVGEGRAILMNENYKSLVYEMTTIDAKWIAKKRLRNLFVKFLKAFGGINHLFTRTIEPFITIIWILHF